MNMPTVWLLLLEDPLRQVIRRRLVAALRAGVHRSAQVLTECRVDGGDPADRGGDRLGDSDPGSLVGGAGGACPATQSGCAGELLDECVALGAQLRGAGAVGPFVGLGEVLVEVV